MQLSQRDSRNLRQPRKVPKRVEVSKADLLLHLFIHIVCLVYRFCVYMHKCVGKQSQYVRVLLTTLDGGLPVLTLTKVLWVQQLPSLVHRLPYACNGEQEIPTMTHTLPCSAASLSFITME